jgi:hypothetical protein
MSAPHLACDGTGDADTCPHRPPPLNRMGQKSDRAADLLHDGHEVRGGDGRKARPPTATRPAALGGPTTVSDGPQRACRLFYRLPERIRRRGGLRHASHRCKSVSGAGGVLITSGRKAASRAATRSWSARSSETRATSAIASALWKGVAGWSLVARLAGKLNAGGAPPRAEMGLAACRKL